MPVSFSNIVFFGDSLTDNGNLPEPVRPDPPYFAGRFSNGPVYAEVLARELGLPADNFALGGAEASTDASDPFPQKLINLSAQVDAYLADQFFFPFAWFFGSVNPGTAASIFIGGNDVINERPSTTAQANDLAARIVSDIGDAVSTLSQAGTQHFILYTLPDVSIPPQSGDLSPAEVAAADATVAAANRGIEALAAQVSPFADVTVIDVNRLELEVVADRETFGIEVVDAPLYDKVGDRLIPTEIRSQFSANEVAFFDPLHPTAAVHRIIAAFSEATLEADRVVLRTSGNDTIVGSFGHDFYMGGVGEDRLSGRSGHDVLLAGAGEDRVDGGTGGDLISGGGGNDVIRGRSNFDLLLGNQGDDVIYGGFSSDLIIGGEGGDIVFGQGGNDHFRFTDDGRGNGLDEIHGGTGTDTLRLAVSSAMFDSTAFKQELQEYATLRDVAPSSAFTFDLLDLTLSSIERLEVVVRGRVVDTVGANTPDPNAVLAAALHDADLWGMA